MKTRYTHKSLICDRSMDRYAMDDFLSQLANRSFGPSVHRNSRFSLFRISSDSAGIRHCCDLMKMAPGSMRFLHSARQKNTVRAAVGMTGCQVYQGRVMRFRVDSGDCLTRQGLNGNAERMELPLIPSDKAIWRKLSIFLDPSYSVPVSAESHHALCLLAWGSQFYGDSINKSVNCDRPMDRFAMGDFFSQFANRSFGPSVHRKSRFSLTGFCLLLGSSFQIDN